MVNKTITIDDDIFVELHPKVRNDFEGSWSKFLNYLLNREVEIGDEK